MGESGVDQVRDHPVLSEFCDPLPRLSDAGADDVSGSVRRFGELLGNRAKPLSVGFRLTGDVERHLALRVGPQGAEVTETEQTTQPDMEIITSEQTWRRIADGSVSPLSAMTGGELRFRGDVLLASRVIHQLRQAAGASEKE